MPRTFSEIAKDIRNNWQNISPAAEPYVKALAKINSSDKNAIYYDEDAETQVLYFLSNAGTWRGSEAKRIKNELKSMIG